MNIFEVQGYVSLIALVAMLGIKGFAFVSSLLYSAEAYHAAGKLTKTTWCAILGLGFAAQVILMGSPFGLINLAAVIAAFVYLADVRPALREMTRGRR